jgi:two-component system LytT family response regulator
MDKNIKYLIVEDEDKSRELLLKKIQMCNISDITCIGMAANATEAILLTKMTPPDFILLDINLPGKSGFDIITELEQDGISPEVIFTSAHTEKEILLSALKYSPITYLVKPIDLDELEEAIRKVCSRIRISVKESEAHGKIRFQGNLGPVFIAPDQLLIIKAEAHYSRLFIENGKEILVNQSISEIERTNLQSFSHLFIKPDRSTIINISKIVSIHTKKKECIISNGNEMQNVKISGNGLKIVLNAMNKHQK